jgi:YidC/Oxa1 family membrane protein insertase
MTWDFLLNPLITLLALFYQVFSNNIVIAIALVTILIRLATTPFTLQQQRSAEKMKVVQPKLQKLQEKYKNDREKLSQEQMALYREEGINPLGGCLPLLIQLPILFALYATINAGLSSTPYQLVDLSNRLLIPGLEVLLPLNKIWLGMDLTHPPTVEVATAPWALALPILVLATTWLQSKLTVPAPTPSPDGKPNPAESMTRSMTTIMPLMFGFFALSFPIGLSIYFIVGNVFAIAQYTALGKADWRSLLGLPAKPKPALASTGPAVSDDLDRVDVVELSRSNKSGNGRGNGQNGKSNGSASREILKTKPNTTQTTMSGSKRPKTGKRK